MKRLFLFSLMIVFFAGCNKTKVDIPKINEPSTMFESNEGKEQCTGNMWSLTGHQPGCVTCPSDTKINDTNTICVCNDPKTVFNTYENKCKKKLTSDQIKFLLR